MNILTFDLEDWFHILAHPQTRGPEQWKSFESRLEGNVERILNILDDHKIRATWFCLGWIAEKYPHVVKKIACHHEMGCHSDRHVLIYQQDSVRFREDTLAVKKRLEDLLGMPQLYYRAAGFSLTAYTSWAFSILAEQGFIADSSVFPAARNHGGFPAFRSQKPCRIMTGSGSLIEFPVTVKKNFPGTPAFAGGGYFRALPYSLIRKWTRQSDYLMAYFHPRDFDPQQPVLPSLPLSRRFMSYVGLKSAEGKFKKLLEDFTFMPLSKALEQVNRDPVQDLYF